MTDFVDIKILQQLEVDTSAEVMPLVLDTFRQETLERVRIINRSIIDRNFSEIAAQAHALKSGAGTFGAYELQQSAIKIEVAIKENNFSFVIDESRKLDVIVHNSLKMLKSYLET